MDGHGGVVAVVVVRRWRSGVKFDPGRAAVPEDAAHVAVRRPMTARILVAGIGNIFLGDDGFGPEVIAPCRAAAPPIRTCPRRRLRHPGHAPGLRPARRVGRPGARRRACPTVAPRHDARLRGRPRNASRATAGLDAHGMDPAAVFASLRALGGTPARRPWSSAARSPTSRRASACRSRSRAAVPDAVRAVEDVLAGLSARTRSREG